MVAYFVACQCFCKSRTSLLVVIRCSDSEKPGLLVCAPFVDSEKQEAVMGRASH